MNVSCRVLLVTFVTTSFTLFGATQTPAPTHRNIVQRRADPRVTHVRILAVVPLIGAGTRADPIRPAYAPLPRAAGAKPDPSGIIGFNWFMSDDKKHALVEFVSRDRSAFKQIMADTRPDVKIFERGKAKRADIEAEFQKHKQNFNLDHFMVRVP